MVLIGNDRLFFRFTLLFPDRPLLSSFYYYFFLIPLHIPPPPESGALLNDSYNTG